MRYLIAIAWGAALACTHDGVRPDRRPKPADTGSTHTGTTASSTPPPTTSTRWTARIEVGAPVPCQQPNLRAVAPFYDRVGAPLSAVASTWAGGVVAGDFRGPEQLDTVVLGETTNQYIYTERSAVTQDGLAFVDHVDDVPDLASLTYAVGGAAADLDGDRLTDLIVTRWDRSNRILINDGAGGFIDQTPPEMLIRTHKTQSVALGDADGDGDLDLFFGNYGDRPPGHRREPASGRAGRAVPQRG